MIKLVMFDMDGVLFDTMPRHAKAWKTVMEEEGCHLPESEYFLHEGRNGKGTIIAVLGPNADHERIYKRKSEIFNSLPEGGAMPGAKRALEEVRKAGVDAIVVTGSGQVRNLSRIASEYPGLFRTEWMVTGNDVTKGKPDPEPYLMGLKKAGVKAGEAIVIENAPLGVESGHAAGCYVVAVNTGPLDDMVLKNAGADVLYQSMDELADNIAELLGKTTA